MQAEGVTGQYAIGGAVGATFYLEPSATLDIDIFIALKPPPGSALVTLAPLFDYLTSRGYRTEHEHVIIEGWPAQFLRAGDALTEEALREAVETDVEGVPVRVISAEHLTAIALKAGRPKDFARILQFIESGVLNSVKLDAILRQHGLVKKWEEFGVRFLRGGL